MNQRRRTLLAQDVQRKLQLFSSAKAARVSVEDLVQAGLGHRASKAAEQAVRNMGKQAFRGLEAWPHVCQFCNKDVESKHHVAKCPACSKEGCPRCVSAKGCPECVAAAQQRSAAAKERARLAEELRK
jgi:hypothetical protein